jgi:hypothetical protein
MELSNLKTIFVTPWPDVNIKELVEYYDEIRSNKKLKIDWVNPGRVDPKIYDEYIENMNKASVTIANDQVDEAAAGITSKETKTNVTNTETEYACLKLCFFFQNIFKTSCRF